MLTRGNVNVSHFTVCIKVNHYIVGVCTKVPFYWRNNPRETSGERVFPIKVIQNATVAPPFGIAAG